MIEYNALWLVAEIKKTLRLMFVAAAAAVVAAAGGMDKIRDLFQQ